MIFMPWMCFVLSLGKSSLILPSYNLQKNCHFHMLGKDSLEHCRETPEDHLCNEPCWESADGQEIASLGCKMSPGSRTERAELYLCRQRCSCWCPESGGKRKWKQKGEGKERKVMDSPRRDKNWIWQRCGGTVGAVGNGTRSLWTSLEMAVWWGFGRQLS